MAVTVEQAAQNALRTWVASKLPDVSVSSRWPDASRPLPEKAVSILRVGNRRDELLDPRIVGTEDIHAALSPRVSPTLAVDLTTTLAALVAAQASYVAHAASTSVHQAADTVNLVTQPVPFDLPSGILAANELRSLVPAHEASTVAH